MKRLLILSTLALGTLAHAQSEIAFYTDLRPSLLYEKESKWVFRWSNPNGQPSLVGFRIKLENGNRILINQRFQRMPGSGDPDSIHEWWIEDTGVWRVGKQVIPFGTRNLINSTVPAARVDTRLLVEDLPIVFAVCDFGESRTRGIVFRIGDERAGFSVASGDHFGIQSTDLTPLQLPSEGLGKGRGWETAWGFDFTINAASATIKAEWLSLRGGETPADENRDISDVKAIFVLPDSQDTLSFGWAHGWDNRVDLMRLEGDFFIDHKMSYQPYLRFDGTRLRDLGVTFRVKL
ncbi:MAG: hypothetical protein KDC26_09210 [Armatimonadetes bacterium]|nr:hypothetical protein [Armatimonadota bacterium]